jgi:hypothetical protein
MNRIAKFAYAQARLQARHGARPDAATWRRLAGIGDLLHFLQTARTTPLRPWVLHFSAQTGVHAMELSLRAQFRHYIAQVASWQPGAWRNAVLWTQRLLDLPALQQLLMGQAAAPWMLEDPVLRPFATENLRARIERLQDSDCGSLVQAWQKGVPLLEGWQQQWLLLWPRIPGTVAAPLQQSVTRLQRHVGTLRPNGGSESSQRACEILADKLVYEFRRHSHQPATAFLHLALVALDLQRLRAALVHRALFPERVEENP